MKLILGSASEPRQQILREMGYDFVVMKPQIDEKLIREEDPEKLVLKLALAKAQALIPLIKDDAILITSDIVMTSHGKILEKPVSPEEAREFIKGYSGSSADAFASAVVTNTKTGACESGVDRAVVYFNEIPSAVIDKLAQKDYAMYCSGAIRIEDPVWKKYIKKIEGDIKTFMGLPPKLTKELIEKVIGD